MTYKQIQAHHKRQERETQKRLRELERQAKEHTKLSAQEDARLQVEAFEAGLAVFLSIHTQTSAECDWNGAAICLPPCPPQKTVLNETKTRLATILRPVETNTSYEAQLLDEREYHLALSAYSAEQHEWNRTRSIAQQIIAGEHKAYVEAITEFSSLSEISDLGSAIHFTIHSPMVVEAKLTVKGAHVIPKEVKMLTAAGKLSVKAMPKARFHELYQDYVCACVLRVGRELFALLPIETVIATAHVDASSSSSQVDERAVLSVILNRESLKRVDFDHADPSDVIDSFQRRGDFKASRKTGEFASVIPYTIQDLGETPKAQSFGDVLATAQSLRVILLQELQVLQEKRSRSTTHRP